MHLEKNVKNKNHHKLNLDISRIYLLREQMTIKRLQTQQQDSTSSSS